MDKILVFGSVNTDLVMVCDRAPEHGETVAGSHFFKNFGGKGANQAVAAAKLGGAVTLIGSVGADAHGAEVRTHLEGFGVDVTALKTVETHPTGVAMITRTGAENRIIVYGGANNTVTADDLKGYLEATEKKPRYFVAQLETGFETTLEALKQAKQAGIMTIFNPAPAKKIPQEAYATIDLLVVNQSEAALLTDVYPKDTAGCQAVYSALETLGLGALIVTLGAEGSVYIDAEREVVQMGETVEAVDTTGAGDAYIGALTYGLSSGLSMEASMKLATRVSALAVTREGAQMAMPTRKEVDAFFDV